MSKLAVKIGAARARKNWRDAQVRRMKKKVCPKCRRSFNKTDRRPTLDHIVPRSKGGADNKSNWQVLCSQCNYRKGSA